MRFVLPLLLILVISCTQKPSKTLIFSGKIDNPKGENLTISGDDFQVSVQVAEDGSFSDTLEIPMGFYNLRHGEWTNVFLKPGYNLMLTLDTDQFDQTVTYSGEGAAENNYLAAKILKDEEVWGERRAFYSLEEAAFLEKLNESITRLTADLNATEGLSDEFKGLELKNLEYKKLVSLSQYPGYHPYFTQKDTFAVSEDFLTPLNGIDYDNAADFAIFDNYRSLVDKWYLNYEILEENPDTLVTVLADIRALKSQNIKNTLMNTLSVFFLSPANPQMTTLYEGIMELSNKEEFKKQVTEKYEKLKALAPGKPAPVFAYKDKDGNTVSLADLKGKYVYIDVWATWCGPCIREIPSLKKIEEVYSKKNIQFVSVSIDPVQDYDKWQQMIVEKELTGIQLFAEGDWKSQLAMDYSIETIPRFILIDPNGLIISADARRPSDPELAKQFDGFGGGI